MTGLERGIDACVKQVEESFGTRKLSKHAFTSCEVMYCKDERGNAQMDQDDYLKQLRPITHSELTEASAEAKATKTVADMRVSLRGALAHALLAQAWLIVSVQSWFGVQRKIGTRKALASSESREAYL